MAPAQAGVRGSAARRARCCSPAPVGAPHAPSRRTLQVRDNPSAPRSRAFRFRAVASTDKQDERNFRGSVSGMSFRRAISVVRAPRRCFAGAPGPINAATFAASAAAGPAHGGEVSAGVKTPGSKSPESSLSDPGRRNPESAGTLPPLGQLIGRRSLQPNYTEPNACSPARHCYRLCLQAEIGPSTRRA